MSSLLQCPCCDFFSLSQRGARDICALCYWEDDGSDLSDLDRVSPANHITLRDARRNFERCGASDEAAKGLVASSSERELYRRELRANMW
ncbi:MAG: hypothetical protein ACI841_001905 [Planctomycetota bacterium]|jgi:hypothetical protein